MAVLAGVEGEAGMTRYIDSEFLDARELLGQPTRRPGDFDVWEGVVEKQEFAPGLSKTICDRSEEILVGLCDANIAGEKQPIEQLLEAHLSREICCPPVLLRRSDKAW